ncbi:MAG TPA: hypothetical protein EYH42_10380 [Sulfurovum sp.]|nr:hypothetical protein [Sulfurovum sp.]
MVYAYMRQIPSLDHLVSQKQNIIAFAHQKGIDIDQDVVEYATKDLSIEERNEFEVFLKSLNEGRHTVIVSSLSVLSTSIDELVKIINCILSHKVDLWVCNANILINTKSSMCEVFPLLEEQRKQPKVKSVHIGRPKGSKSRSKFDIFHNQIMALLSEKKSVSAIARILGVRRSSLKDYIESRSLKELVQSVSIVDQKIADKPIDNVVLICPFEIQSN